ncbi:unnamed protein product [Amoebophrya sp. A25]|nr:unnamed protein product [Amoebophrya sp. A25]|eukprot:GSA25T00013589001.1
MGAAGEASSPREGDSEVAAHLRRREIRKTIAALQKELSDLEPRKGCCCWGKAGEMKGLPVLATAASKAREVDGVVADERPAGEYPLDFAMKMLQILWPNAERAFAKRIQYGIVPMLAKDLPPAMQDISVRRIYLGKKRPTFGPLRLRPPVYVNGRPSQNLSPSKGFRREGSLRMGSQSPGRLPSSFSSPGGERSSSSRCPLGTEGLHGAAAPGSSGGPLSARSSVLPSIPQKSCAAEHVETNSSWLCSGGGSQASSSNPSWLLRSCMLTDSCTTSSSSSGPSTSSADDTLRGHVDGATEIVMSPVWTPSKRSRGQEGRRRSRHNTRDSRSRGDRVEFRPSASSDDAQQTTAKLSYSQKNRSSRAAGTTSSSSSYNDDNYNKSEHKRSSARPSTTANLPVEQQSSHVDDVEGAHHHESNSAFDTLHSRSPERSDYSANDEDLSLPLSEVFAEAIQDVLSEVLASSFGPAMTPDERSRMSSASRSSAKRSFSASEAGTSRETGSGVTTKTSRCKGAVRGHRLSWEETCSGRKPDWDSASSCSKGEGSTTGGNGRDRCAGLSTPDQRRMQKLVERQRVVEGSHRQDDSSAFSDVVLDDKVAPEASSPLCCSPQAPHPGTPRRGREDSQQSSTQGAEQKSSRPDSARSERREKQEWQEAAGYLGTAEVEQLAWEMPFEWRSDMVVEFSALNGMVRFGCEEFFMKGEMQIVMRPILNELPLYGGATVGFINPPQMDFNFVGTGAGLAHVPLFARKLRHEAESQFAKRFVLPNSMFIRMGPVEKLDLASLKFHPPPEFCARVEVLEARNVPSSDFHIFSQASSDPYVKFKLGSLGYQTDVIPENLHPVWSQYVKRSGEFMIYNSKQRLYVELFDRDVLSSDDLLAKGDWVIGDIFGDHWHDLEPVVEPSGSAVSTKIRLRVTKLQLQVQSLEMPETNRARPNFKGSLTRVVDPFADDRNSNTSAEDDRDGIDPMEVPTRVMRQSIAHTKSVLVSMDAVLRPEKPIPLHCQPHTFLLEVRVWGCTGCKASGMSAVNLRLDIAGKNYDTGRSLQQISVKPGTLEKGGARARASATANGIDELVGEDAEKIKNIGVSAEVVQKLKFAGFTGAKIAKFLGCDAADVNLQLRGAHEEIWCRSVFAFIRDPEESEVKFSILGSKSAFDPSARYKKYHDEAKKSMLGARLVTGAINRISSGVAAVTRLSSSQKRRSSQASTGRKGIERAERDFDQLVVDSAGTSRTAFEGGEKAASVEEDVFVEEEFSLQSSPTERPEDPEDPVYRENIAKQAAPNVYELANLLEKDHGADRQMLKPGGNSVPLEVDVSFQLYSLVHAP